MEPAVEKPKGEKMVVDSQRRTTEAKATVCFDELLAVVIQACWNSENPFGRPGVHYCESAAIQ